jgi:hypothetical protein
MEDLDSPLFAINEMIRCCKSGYIETPSPLIETTKGVDGNTGFQKLYAGYIHHRYIIWSSIEKCEIYILPKYNSILDHFLKFTNRLSNEAIDNPFLWNNYFLWKNKTPKVIVYKNNVDINSSNFIYEYCKLIERSINESIQNTFYFLNMQMV